MNNSRERSIENLEVLRAAEDRFGQPASYREKLTDSKKRWAVLARVLAVTVASLVLATHVTKSFAHGEGEEEGEKPAAVSSGQMNIKLAALGSAEAVVKYPTPKPGEEVALLIFLTDLKTNAPITKADLTLVMSYSDPNQLPNNTHAAVHPAAGKALPTDTPGIYQAKVVLPELGQYNLALSLGGENPAAGANITGIVVPGAASQAEDGLVMERRSLLLVAAAVLFLLAGIMSYFFWIRPRRGTPEATMGSLVNPWPQEHKQ